MKTKPWYSTTHKPYSTDVARAVKASIGACSQLRRLLLLAASSNTYLYHREWVEQVLTAGLHDSGTTNNTGFTSSHMNWRNSGTGNRPTVNICKSAVDSVSSSMFSDPPLIEIQPEGASFDELIEWEERELALNATMNRRESREIHRKSGRDGLVTGEGHIYPCYENGDIVYRKLNFEQVLYDPYDCQMGPPTYQHMIDLPDRLEFRGFIERLQVRRDGSRAPMTGMVDKLQAIDDAPCEDAILPDLVNTYRPLEQWMHGQTTGTADTDRIRVAHSWRRAARDGMDDPDGRYCITLLDGADPVVVLDMPYRRTRLPVVSWSPFPGENGLGGSGLVALLQGWQYFIDRTLAKITDDQDKYGYIKLLVNKNEFQPKDVTAMLKRGIDVVGVSNPGTKPEWYRPQVLSKEDLDVLTLGMDLSRSEYGISRMLTQGTSQLKGQVSGIAIVEEDAKTRDRLSDIREQYADFRLRVATATLDVMDDAREHDPEFRVHYRTPGGESVSKPWSELTRVNGKFTLQVEEVGVLGRTRAGRYAKLLDLWAKQAIPDDLAKNELMKSPDMLKLSRLQTAGSRLAQRHMRDLIKTPQNPPVPSKDLDLEITLTIVTQTLRYAMSNEAPMPTQTAMRNYKVGVEALIATSAPQPPSANEMPAEGAPPAL